MSLFTGCVANGALCGPFLISKGFWIDAGRCVLDGDDPDSDEGNLRVHHFDILSNVEIGVEYWMIFVVVLAAVNFCILGHLQAMLKLYLF